MRGKGAELASPPDTSGITPAYAGKRAHRWTYSQRNWDHPRLCGEKFKRIRCRLGRKGSPPPMRGKVLAHYVMYQNVRITPAYAGKSCICEQYAKYAEDHPRLCGEKDLTKDTLHWYKGSPPPMRGKGLLWNPQCTPAGITPAYAGKSSSFSRQDLYDQGSPPPMRGKADWYFVVHILARITPAYAGKRCTHACFMRHCKDHPRLCGEKGFDNSILFVYLGSPPPMRGKVNVMT